MRNSLECCGEYPPFVLPDSNAKLPRRRARAFFLIKFNDTDRLERKWLLIESEQGR